MFLILLLFLSALFVEGIGSVISIIGLAATFASDPIIITMAVSLDFCKIIAVNVLAKKWHQLSKAIRGYLVASTLVLMLITSGGIASYLSNSFQKAMVPTQGTDIALVNMTKEQDRLQSRKKEIDAQIAQLPSSDVRGRQRLTTSFKSETVHINTRLIEIDKELPKAQTAQVKETTEVGSILFLAKALGVTPEVAVMIIIALIIFVFDPLSIVFLITANILWDQHSKERLELKTEVVTKKDNDYVLAALEPAGKIPTSEVPALPTHVDDSGIDKMTELLGDIIEKAGVPREQYTSEHLDDVMRTMSTPHVVKPKRVRRKKPPAVVEEKTYVSTQPIEAPTGGGDPDVLEEPNGLVESETELQEIVHSEITTRDFVVSPDHTPESLSSLANLKLEKVTGSDVTYIGDLPVNPDLLKIYNK